MVKRRKDKAKGKKKVSLPPAGPLVKRVMPNPEHRPEHDERLGNPKETEVTLNTAESAIETLHSRKLITNLQKIAADKVRELWEAYTKAGVPAFDYSADRVSAGRAPVPVSETQIAARDELRRIRLYVGQRGLDLLTKICGEGVPLKDIGHTNRERTTAADNLRTHLDDVARLLGLWGGRKKR